MSTSRFPSHGNDPLDRARSANKRIAEGGRLGGYRVKRRIGLGGMGEVFIGEHLETGREVALKVLLSELRGDQEIVRSFVDEAHIAAELAHPNIVDVYDFGESEGSFYIAMEYIDGWDLRRIGRLAQNHGRYFSPGAAAYVVHEVATALHYVHTHERQIVHRDVTPHNVFVTRTGHIKLGDFGIAKAATRTSRTLTGQIKGKLPYLAPEQIRGEPITRRTDVYALGLLLFELLTNERFNPGRSDGSLVAYALNPQRRKPSAVNPSSMSLDDITLNALAIHPTMRTPDAGLLADRLEAHLRRDAFDAEQMVRFVDSLLNDELAETSPFNRPPQLGSVVSGTLKAPGRQIAPTAPSLATDKVLATFEDETTTGGHKTRSFEEEAATAEELPSTRRAVALRNAMADAEAEARVRPAPTNTAPSIATTASVAGNVARTWPRVLGLALVLAAFAATFYTIGRMSNREQTVSRGPARPMEPTRLTPEATTSTSRLSQADPGLAAASAQAAPAAPKAESRDTPSSTAPLTKLTTTNSAPIVTGDRSQRTLGAPPPPFQAPALARRPPVPNPSRPRARPRTRHGAKSTAHSRREEPPQRHQLVRVTAEVPAAAQANPTTPTPAAPRFYATQRAALALALRKLAADARARGLYPGDTPVYRALSAEALRTQAADDAQRAHRAFATLQAYVAGFHLSAAHVQSKLKRLDRAMARATLPPRRRAELER